MILRLPCQLPEAFVACARHRRILRIQPIADATGIRHQRERCLTALGTKLAHERTAKCEFAFIRRFEPRRLFKLS